MVDAHPETGPALDRNGWIEFSGMPVERPPQALVLARISHQDAEHKVEKCLS